MVFVLRSTAANASMDVAGAIFGAAGPQAELNLCVGTKNDDNAFRQNNRNVNEVGG
jgi:hypothetical protein